MIFNFFKSQSYLKKKKSQQTFLKIYFTAIAKNKNLNQSTPKSYIH